MLVRSLFVVALAASCSRTAPDPTPTAAAAVATPHAKRGDRRNPVDPHAPRFQLAVRVAGAAKTWTQDDVEKVARYAVGHDGEGRDVWSLRELAHALVGPNARVTAVVGPEGKQVIDAAMWADAGKTPLLHTTRRNTLKLTWADSAGAWGETTVKDVASLEITP